MKTVFIIGAGASEEAKLPTGYGLKGLIAHALNNSNESFNPSVVDPKIDQALSRVVITGQPNAFETMAKLLSAAQHIHRAMPQAASIDSFIDSNNGDKEIELCGKLAIVRTILDAEAKSDVFVGHRPDGSTAPFRPLEGTWFYRFFQLLIDGRMEDLQKRLDSIVLIIFNYDRCIEFYLYNALQNYYPQMDGGAAAALLQRLEIYHPYGTVGSLPWSPSNRQVPFGHDPAPSQLLDLAKGIKTFTEGTDESSSHVKAIRSSMDKGERLVFLGFAFHRLNMELLLPAKNLSSRQNFLDRRIYATAHGMSGDNAEVIVEDLSIRTSLSRDSIKIHRDLKCDGLMKEYSLRLSLI